MADFVKRSSGLWWREPEIYRPRGDCDLLTNNELVGFNAGSDEPGTVVFHCHFDGSDASTTFTDVKGHALTPAGNAQIDTGQFKFGSASGQFDGTGDYITAADSADWDFGAGDFTIELWARFASVAGSDQLAGQYNGGTGFSWLLARGSSAATDLAFYASADGSANAILIVSAAGVFATNTWYHIAAVRHGNRFDIYIDGVSVANTTNSFTLFNSTNVLSIGGDALGSLDMNGWIDEMRIVKGGARYIANFTPPTAAFPDV